MMIAKYRQSRIARIEHGMPERKEFGGVEAQVIGNRVRDIRMLRNPVHLLRLEKARADKRAADAVTAPQAPADAVVTSKN